MKDENPYVDRVCSKIQLRIYKSDCIYISTKVVFIKGEQQLQSINPNQHKKYSGVTVL
jgi:hypothetical protein